MQHKLILENFRKFTKNQEITKHAQEVLKELFPGHAGIAKLCNTPNFNQLLIKAVENPNNRKAFRALRNAVFGAKKDRKRDKGPSKHENMGTITIINQCDHDLYDFRVIQMGPPWKGQDSGPSGIGYRAAYFTENREVIVGDGDFKLLSPYADEGQRQLKKGTAIQFTAPNKVFRFSYRWYPERFYSAPGEIREEWRAAFGLDGHAGFDTFHKYVENEPEAGFIRFLSLLKEVEMARPYYPLEKGVEWILEARPGKRAAGLTLNTDGTADDPNAIRVPSFAKLECVRSESAED